MRQHGTRSCYVHGPQDGPGEGCRCEPCKAANRDYMNGVTRQKAYGRWEPWASRQMSLEVVEHLLALRAAGVGYKSVAKAAGVPTSQVFRLISGRTTRMRHRTAEALLAVTASDAADHAIVEGAETHRLVDELVRAGIPRYRIAREALGLEGAKALQLQERVLVRTARNIRAYHDHRWPIDPKLREACRCYTAITFEERRERDKLAHRQRREAMSA